MSAQSRRWFQRWFPDSGRPGDRRLPRRQPRRPALEQLEDRLVLSTLFPYASRRDLVYDSARNLLDVVTAQRLEGVVARALREGGRG